MYIECCRFLRGVFQKREAPFFSKDAHAVFDKVVAKYIGSNDEVLITIRHDNHTLVRSWTNVKPITKGNALIVNARGTKTKKKKK